MQTFPITLPDGAIIEDREHAFVHISRYESKALSLAIDHSVSVFDEDTEASWDALSLEVRNQLRMLNGIVRTLYHAAYGYPVVCEDDLPF